MTWIPRSQTFVNLWFNNNMTPKTRLKEQTIGQKNWGERMPCRMIQYITHTRASPPQIMNRHGRREESTKSPNQTRERAAITTRESVLYGGLTNWLGFMPMAERMEAKANRMVKVSVRCCGYGGGFRRGYWFSTSAMADLGDLGGEREIRDELSTAAGRRENEGTRHRVGYLHEKWPSWMFNSTGCMSDRVEYLMDTCSGTCPLG